MLAPTPTPLPAVTDPTLQTWLTFVSTFIWQAILAAVLYKLFPHTKVLIARLGKLKYGDAELTFQQAAPSEPPPPTTVDLPMWMLGGGSFLSEAAIDKIVEGSGRLAESETVRQRLLLFETAKQHTWLVFGALQVFCVLDDEKTRGSKRLVQWALPLKEALPIRARERSATTGLLDIGARSNWLYSVHLHPDPAALEARLTELVTVGAAIA